MAAVSLALLGSPGLAPAAVAVDPPAGDESSLRIGVLALAGAISAVGQTPELATPLPFTTSSLADVLELDESLTTDLAAAMNGTDLEEALGTLEGVRLVDDGSEDLVTFTYRRSVEDHPLSLVHDDGDLRFGANEGAGLLDVSLTTRASDPFVVSVDRSQEDPLLRTQLVSQPVMDLVVDIDTDDLAGFDARQGFTEVEVSGGHYRIHREQTIRMRDPDGRGVLTLEDLRYSTLPDLFSATTKLDASGEPLDRIDLALEVLLPSSLAGGAAADRDGTLTVTTADTPAGKVWPSATDATRDYGPVLESATGLTMADGLTGLAQYTGTVLALQDAAEVPFPHLAGGTSDLFAPGDRLLDLLSTAAAAQVRCGAAPGNPPSGVAAPGDTVYCDAVTPEGLTQVSGVTWSVKGGGTVIATPAEQTGALGSDPTSSVRIDGSDGEPDVSVAFTSEGQRFVARSMPRTVQEVVARIGELGESSATASIGGGRLDVGVDIAQGSSSKDLEIGNPGTLGALVGLTGLSAPGGEPATAAATAQGSSFDVGFGIETGTTAEGVARQTYLIPEDASLLRVQDLSAVTPTGVTGLDARIGFLGVKADLSVLTLGRTSGSQPAVELTREGGSTAPLPISDLLTEQGALDPSQVALTSNLEASIGFTATEKPLPGGGNAASGTATPAAGTATVRWGPAGLPSVTVDGGYERLRVFDPVPARFLSGRARVTEDAVEIEVALPTGTTLYDVLNVASPTGGERTEVARRMLADGAACQNVTIVDGTTLTCQELVDPTTGPVLADQQAVQMIVLGDPFALRDSVLEGFASTLNQFDQLAGDNVTGDGLADDQYTSTLPLAALTPAQLAGERDDLRAGLGRMVRAAAEDEQSGGGPLPPVSSAQELRTAVGQLVQGGAQAPSLSYELDDQTLTVALKAFSAGTPLQAAYRADVGDLGLVQSQALLPVGVSSHTTLAIDVARGTGQTATADATRTESTATVSAQALASRLFQTGVGEARSTGAAGNRADLGVKVVTDYHPSTAGGSLLTTRSGTRGGERAAVMTLEFPDGTTVDYRADATGSSGGSGTEQPAREAMEVKYVAEGLDGLADALESASDGAAPRNTQGGPPVSAPLIGTDLGAGAEVPETLRTLTSALRDQLAGLDAADAGELTTQLRSAVPAAVNSVQGLDTIAASDVTVTVTCGGDEGACEPCPEPEAGEEPDECTSETPTGWETVRVDFGLGGHKAGKTTFDTGLAGLEVRSDEMVDTTTTWTLPVSLELVRGVGPRVVVDPGDALRLDVEAKVPSGLRAIVGYLPAKITAPDSDGTVHTVVNIAPRPDSYDLFDLFDGKLSATPTFTNPGTHVEDGIRLRFESLVGGSAGAFDLSGRIDVPWRAGTGEGAGYGPITYNEVALDMGEVVDAIATPFAVVDPYLAPVRDVVEVLRTPIPVISDLSELAGGGEISLLSLLETLSAATRKPQLELAHRVIGLVGGVTDVMHGIAQLKRDAGSEGIPLERLSQAGAALTLDPAEVKLYDKCTQTVTTSKTTTTGGTQKSTSAAKPCPDKNVFAQGRTKPGAPGQTTNENRKGTRNTKQRINQRTASITGSVPGFSMPFMTDTDQLMDVLTGEGEASYFRLDLGTLAASVSYTQRFGPIMAGPVPIMPFVGGSISVEGRLAMGFDSHAQTLAVQNLSHQGDVQGLIEAYGEFDEGNVIREGFYVDDLDADGVDVPEVKLVTTLQAGAGVSIGIVTAGLKGGITLTIGLDLNDPDDDGRLRAAEIRDSFNSQPGCIFDAKGELEAFISVFVQIELLLTSLEYDFDILRLGPYTLFEYGCPDKTPVLVTQEGSQLVLTSGSRSGQRLDDRGDVSDEYEVRQFDTGGGAPQGGTTTYEVTAFGRVQTVVVEKVGSTFTTLIYGSGITTSTDEGQKQTFTSPTMPTFAADGGGLDDQLSFLQGERFTEDGGELVLSTTAFTTPVAVGGGAGDDSILAGDGVDTLSGGEGHDVLDTGAGNDSADGGAGDDVVGGGSGRDDLTGGDGSDRLEGGPGGDRAAGGTGADSLVGGPGRDVRALIPREHEGDDRWRAVATLGFDTGDVLVGGGQADSVDGGDGSDVVVGGDAPALTGVTDLDALFTARPATVNVLTRGSTNPQQQEIQLDTATVPRDEELDPLCASGLSLSGSANSDFVTGGPERDVVVGGDGPDRLDGGSGPDEICGRAGDDQLTGDGGATQPGSNADVVRGGVGDDRADGGAGDDVLFGDDTRLWRDGVRVLDGSLGGAARGEGDDYLDGSEGDDVASGGEGSDLLLGGVGDDDAFGEGRDTGESGGARPALSDRLLACNPTTRVVGGKVDLDGDLLAGSGGDGLTADTGRLAGLPVSGGVIGALGTGGPFEGLLGTDVVVVGGLVDLDRDGVIGPGDTGAVPLVSMLGVPGSNSDGDCVIAGEGDDQLLGGTGSDHLSSGDGTDLASGGDGNDLVLGDDGTDVVLGGSHDDVLVGGLADDHLTGGDGDDRLHGNEGADDLVGGTDRSGASDGQDVLLGGREDDVLAAENAAVVSGPVVEAVTAETVSWRGEPAVPAAVTAGEDSALTFADSALVCGDEEPDRWLTVLVGDGRDGSPAQSPGTPLAYDELYGGFDCDFLVGSTGDDLVRGGQDDDVVEAGPGDDLAQGDDGEDVVLGGSSLPPTEDTRFTASRSGAGVPDGDDVVLGDGGPDSHDGSDLVAGDNALPTRVAEVEGREGPAYRLTLHDVALAGADEPDPTTSGADRLDAGGEADRVFGQGGADLLGGGTGDDYVEGNAGDDGLTGGEGDDDLLGGSSVSDGQPLGADGLRLLDSLSAAPYDDSAAGLVDGDDTAAGGPGDDVVLGDNGRITRPGPDTTVRDVALTDETDSTVAVAAGADTLTGGDDDDRLFGGDDGDDIDAGGGADHAEGNPGVDRVFGGPDEDVVIGGSSVSPAGDGTIGALPTVAIPDGNDVLYGDEASDGVAASDLLLGDNATALVLDSGLQVVQLADVPLGSDAAPGTSGDDTIDGGGAPDAGPGAPDRVFGQGGDDSVTTGSSGDYVEGNSGADVLRSGAGTDDVIGGSSAADGRPLGESGTRLQQRVEPRLDVSAAGVHDEDDEIQAGFGEDTVLGDNGRVTRPTDGLRPVPDVAMADTGDASTYGSDTLLGEEDDDVLHGQLDDGAALGEGDLLEGGEGDDALLGDLAVVKRTPARLLSAPRTLALRSEMISEQVYRVGTTVPETWVPSGQATNGGPDLALGGEGDDVLHLGGGEDLANGDQGEDVVFGGDGEDALWGGADADRIFGGYGADDLDLKLRTSDPAAYADARGSEDSDGRTATHNGADLVYGGYGPDELQADVGGAGRAPGSDHLVDWVGAHNVYYVCEGAYGAGRIIRESSPAMMDLLVGLAEAAGAREVEEQSSGGWYDLGLVGNRDKSSNTRRSPEHPGNFTCG
ncbi:MAG TPA: calcium-binding protein [Nocardioides sp.]|nr:calcium-binding protein [Nocardioides sp.]